MDNHVSDCDKMGIFEEKEREFILRDIENIFRLDANHWFIGYGWDLFILFP